MEARPQGRMVNWQIFCHNKHKQNTQGGMSSPSPSNSSMLMNFDSFCTVGFWSTANVSVAHNHFKVLIQSSHALDNLQTTAQINWKQIIFHVKIEDFLMAT